MRMLCFRTVLKSDYLADLPAMKNKNIGISHLIRRRADRERISARRSSRAIEAQSDHQSRSRRAGHLLRRVRYVGRSDGANPEIRDHGQIANRLSDTIALSFNRQPTGRDHDADRIGIRVYPCKPQPNFCASFGSITAVRWRAGGVSRRPIDECDLHDV
jgi:hypothetical protein